jgi:SAM domain (Sterile alpha motif)
MNKLSASQYSRHSAEQVRNWDHVETARQLRDLGVEAKHCDIFEQQEITGEVLLEMDQTFILMDKFDFGVMGRRLKTWHEIKRFQEEIESLSCHIRSIRPSLPLIFIIFYLPVES